MERRLLRHQKGERDRDTEGGNRAIAEEGNVEGGHSSRRISAVRYCSCPGSRIARPRQHDKDADGR